MCTQYLFEPVFQPKIYLFFRLFLEFFDCLYCVHSQSELKGQTDVGINLTDYTYTLRGYSYNLVFIIFYRSSHANSMLDFKVRSVLHSLHCPSMRYYSWLAERLPVPLNLHETMNFPHLPRVFLSFYNNISKLDRFAHYLFSQTYLCTY